MWKIGLVIIVFVEALFTGVIPVTKSLMYGELANHTGNMYYACMMFGANMILLGLTQATKPFIVLRTALKSREHRTLNLNVGNHSLEFKPQRVQEDIKLSYVQRYTAYVEYGISFLILMYLLYVNIAYPSLIISALVYAGISVVLAYLFNPKLTEAEKMVQNTEASFRNTLIEVWDLTHVLSTNQVNIKAAKIRLGYGLFTALQAGILSAAPFVILIPFLAAGQISFQEVVGHSMTFGLIVVNAAILLTIYPVLIQGKASEERVQELEKRQ